MITLRVHTWLHIHAKLEGIVMVYVLPNHANYLLQSGYRKSWLTWCYSRVHGGPLRFTMHDVYNFHNPHCKKLMETSVQVSAELD